MRFFYYRKISFFIGEKTFSRLKQLTILSIQKLLAILTFVSEVRQKELKIDTEKTKAKLFIIT